MNQPLLLDLKKRQTRHEECSLVIPNERQITTYGVFSSLTRRAKAHFPLSSVIIRLCRLTTPRLFCLAQSKMGLGSNDWFIESAP